MNNAVNNPSHYTQDDGIECIDAIQAALTEEEWRGFLRGNCLKYLWRYRHKGAPMEDLQKAEVYRQWLYEAVEDEMREINKSTEVANWKNRVHEGDE